MAGGSPLPSGRLKRRKQPPLRSTAQIIELTCAALFDCNGRCLLLTGVARLVVKTKTPACPPGFLLSRSSLTSSSGNLRLVLGRLAQHVAAAPHGLDVVLA